MTDAQAALAQVREALAAGPTPGTRSILDDHRGDTWVTCDDRIDEGLVEICMVERGFDEPFESEQIANANFIAACSPANIAAILAHIEAQAAEIERLTAALQHEADCVEAAKEEIERLTACGSASDDPAQRVEKPFTVETQR